MRSNRLAWFVVLAAGCGGGGAPGLDGIDEAEGTQEQMAQFADSAGAAAVYSQAMLPLFVAAFSSQDEAPCPVIVEGETMATYDGGCTDASGNEWFGHAEATAMMSDSPSGPARTVYDGFGFTGDLDGCPGLRGTTVWNGTLEQTPEGGGIAFDISLRLEVDGFDEDNGCVELHDAFGIEYAGTWITTEGPEDDINTFNGAGRVGTTSLGSVSVSTDDEVLDDSLCGDEAASGTTTITAGGHTAVVTYDGATDCDPESTVTWTYDGADQGELTGVSCSTGGGRSGLMSLLLVAGAARWRRRRAPRR